MHSHKSLEDRAVPDAQARGREVPAESRRPENGKTPGRDDVAGNFPGNHDTVAVNIRINLGILADREVAARIIEEWANSKKIPARFDNGHWVFAKAEVDQWIQQERARV